MSSEELRLLTGCFFALGIIYKIKLERKFGGRDFTQADIDRLESDLSIAVSNLPREQQDLIEKAWLDSDFGIVTGVYGTNKQSL